MNFQQLEYILAVDQQKHFAKAADTCHVTQATLSGMIKKLEEELGVVVFDRSKQPIKTTDDGRDVLKLANQILQLQSELLELKDQNTTVIPEGTLRIGIIPTVANSLLPIILPTILSDYPDLHLEISEITTEEIKTQLVNDQIDAGILATPLGDDSFEENILYYEAMMVYGVLKSNKKFVSTDVVRDQKIWLLEEGNCFRNQTSTICNIQEKSKGLDNLSFEGSSFDTLLNLTDRFGGYTLIPELYYYQMSHSKKQLTRHFEKPMPVREISLVYHRPYARKRSLDQLSTTIEGLLASHLSTSKLKAQDMEIVGI